MQLLLACFYVLHDPHCVGAGVKETQPDLSLWILNQGSHAAAIASIAIVEGLFLSSSVGRMNRETMEEPRSP